METIEMQIKEPSENQGVDIIIDKILEKRTYVIDRKYYQTRKISDEVWNSKKTKAAIATLKIYLTKIKKERMSHTEWLEIYNSILNKTSTLTVREQKAVIYCFENSYIEVEK